MRSPELSVFIPAYNEIECFETSVNTVHEYLNSHSIDHEVIVVDNGSSDGTGELGKDLALKHDWLKFKKIEARGAGNAFRKGVTLASSEKVICLDMDLSSDLLFLVLAYNLLDYSDMVVGSKTLGAQRRSFFRIAGSQTYIMLANLWLSLTVSDYSIGCKAFKKSQVLPILNDLDGWTGYMLELVLFARIQKRKVVQIGVDCDDRRPSHFNLFHEGVYRYRHLYATYKELKSKASWFYKSHESAVVKSGS